MERPKPPERRHRQSPESITTAYQENSPEFLYFYALYNIFGSFLEQVNEDDLPSETNGFKESQVWNKLYTFQKDAVIAIISKLEQYNGCILADSVGLGKPSPLWPSSNTMRTATCGC